MTMRHLLTSNRRVSSQGFGLHLISQQVISAAATVEVVGFTDTFQTYFIEISGLRPASDDTDLLVRTGLNGTYASGGSNYVYSFAVKEGTTAGVVDQQSIGASSITVTSPTPEYGWANSTDATGSVTLKIIRPTSTSSYPVIGVDAHWYAGFSINDLPVHLAGTGVRLSIGAIDGIQILMNTGNISTATVQLYGLGP